MRAVGRAAVDSPPYWLNLADRNSTRLLEDPQYALALSRPLASVAPCHRHAVHAGRLNAMPVSISERGFHQNQHATNVIDHSTEPGDRRQTSTDRLGSKKITGRRRGRLSR
jgi:hypothetical protein